MPNMCWVLQDTNGAHGGQGLIHFAQASIHAVCYKEGKPMPFQLLRSTKRCLVQNGSKDLGTGISKLQDHFLSIAYACSMQQYILVSDARCELEISGCHK